MDLRLASEVADLPIEKSDLDGTVDSALRVLAAALPERWQITVMPGLITIGQSLKEVPGAQLVLRSQS
ncbi:hypothetical protein AQI96_13260 [Streptomyces canus]|nr:hypothetical protein AQI96_13260 [Streptomyces canus]